MPRLVDTDGLWRSWPLLVTALAWAVFLGGLRTEPSPASSIGAPELAALESGVLELRVELAPVCGGTGSDACSQRGEPQPAAPLPIAGATLRVLRSEQGIALPVGEVRTGADGGARLELRRGTYWLLVEAEGRARWSAPFELSQPLQALRVALVPAVPLRVSVRGGDGRALPGALVLVYADDVVPRAALTSELGEASFGDVAEHIESIRVSAAGHASSSVEPTSRDVSLQLSSPASLLVSVLTGTHQPASGADVWLSGLDVWPPRRARTGADGTLVWEGLSRGTYDLRAELLAGVAGSTLTLERGEHRAVTLELVPGRFVEVQVSESAAGGAPIAGADVVLVEEGLGPFPLHGLTDAQGRVTLGPLPPGGATVNARAGGFMPESAVPVQSDALHVELALTRGGRLRGRVLDPAGQPIAGASLEVIGSDLRGQPIARRAWLDPLGGTGARSSSPPAPLIPLGELGVLPGPLPVPGGALGGTPKAPWVTDAAGNFRLDDVPPGRVRVLGRHPDFVEAMSEELELAPAGELSLQLELRKGAALSGRVIEAGGAPVARARIDAQARHALQQTTVLSRDDGSFEFRSVATDLDVFVARPSDRQRFVLRQSLQLQAGETRQLELSLPPERPAFEVLVLGDDKRPLEGAVVSVLSLEPSAPLRRSLATDPAGLVRFADAAGLGLALRVQAAGFGTFETQLDAAPVRVEVGLESAVRVTGRVTHVRGRQGLPGALVVWIQGGERRTTHADARGEFQISEASPGDARVRVSHAGFSTRVSDLVIPGTGRVDRAFELPPIDLVEAGSVSGRVLDADGEPVRGARVGVGVVPAFVPAGADPPGLVRSDGAGQFRLDEVPVGRVSVSAYAAGSGRGSVEAVDVRAGETTGPIEIQLLIGGTDPDADALANVAITLGERAGRAGTEVVIVNVAAGSEAERADLREGDVVRAVDGWDVRGMAEARGYLGGSDGSDVIIELDRDGEWLSLNVRREAVRR